MIRGTTVTFTVIEGKTLYEVPEKVHIALQLVSEMQKQRKPGSIILHIDAEGNVAKVEQKKFF
jgi:hypothetical protein